MNELNINMLSEADLKELLDIRTQITKLQQRYDQIMNGSRSNSPSPTPVSAQPIQPATVQPQPARPAPSPVAAAPVTPSPTPLKPAVAAAPSPVARAAAPRPQAARPAPVSPRPMTASTATRTTPAVTAPKAEDAEPIKVDSSIISNLKQALVQMLTTAGKPMAFNNIYSKLQEMGVQLPDSKPMLVVRKLLYDKALFDVVKGGLFQIKAELDATGTAIGEQLQASKESVQAPIQTEPAAAAMPAQPPPPALSNPATAPQHPRQASSFSARLDAILNQ